MLSCSGVATKRSTGASECHLVSCRCPVRNEEAAITELRASDMIDGEDNVRTLLGWPFLSTTRPARAPLYTGPLNLDSSRAQGLLHPGIQTRWPAMRERGGEGGFLGVRGLLAHPVMGPGRQNTCSHPPPVIAVGRPPDQVQGRGAERESRADQGTSRCHAGRW
jgi:hypothetical protein